MSSTDTLKDASTGADGLLLAQYAERLRLGLDEDAGELYGECPSCKSDLTGRIDSAKVRLNCLMACAPRVILEAAGAHDLRPTTDGATGSPAEIAAWLHREGFQPLPLWTPAECFTGHCSEWKDGKSCNRPGKHPHVTYSEYAEGRRSERRDVERWWETWPQANVGLMTGKAYGIAVLDCDDPSALDVLERHNATSPVAVRTGIKTAAGWRGRQFVYRYPDGATVGNRVKLHVGGVAHHLDSRGDGGIAVFIGSQHKSGVCYEKAGDWPRKKPFAAAPPFPLHLFDVAELATRQKDDRPAVELTDERRQSMIDRARRFLRAAGPAIQGEGGDPKTFRMAAVLVRDAALDDATALALLKEWNTTCRPPWPERDLLKKIETAHKSGKARVGAWLEPKAQQSPPRPAAALLLEGGAPGDHGTEPVRNVWDTARPELGKPEQGTGPAGKEPWKPDFVNVADLLKMEFPPVQWSIPDILPEGCFLFVGKSKVGKSWAALELAIAVASGGRAFRKISVEPGAVLYAALEDTKRRMKDRVSKLTQDDPGIDLRKMETVYDLPRGAAGCAHIEDWLKDHPDARLVVVDVLAKFREPSSKGESIYSSDYATVSTIKRLSDEYRVTILLVHHTRKADADDAFDTISGSMGLMGAADGALILARPRFSPTAVLSITGRDIEQDGERALKWDDRPGRAGWILEEEPGAALMARMEPASRAIADMLRELGRSMTLEEIFDEASKRGLGAGTKDAIKKRLQRMVDADVLTQPGRGRFAVSLAFDLAHTATTPPPHPEASRPIPFSSSTEGQEESVGSHTPEGTGGESGETEARVRVPSVPSVPNVPSVPSVPTAETTPEGGGWEPRQYDWDTWDTNGTRMGQGVSQVERRMDTGLAEGFGTIGTLGTHGTHSPGRDTSDAVLEEKAAGLSSWGYIPPTEEGHEEADLDLLERVEEGGWQ